MINHSEWLTQCDNYGSEELRLSKVDFRQSEARPMSEKEKDNRHKKRNKSAQESKGLAVIPYVEGLSKTSERTFRKYGINTAMKPYRTLRQLLVHQKDQRTVEQTGECVYRIPFHNCDCTYIGETGRNYGKRQDELRKEVESISNRTFTRSDRKSRTAEMNKSAITDHVGLAKENYVINWSGAKILEREGHRKTEAGQGVDLNPERTQLHEQRWRGVQLTDSL